MINKKNYKLLLLATFSFIITTTLFQNCSPVKLSKNLGLPDSNFSEGLSYAPKSVSGSQVITNGNVVLKEYRHKASNRYFYTSRVNDQALLDTTYAGLFEVTGNTIAVKAAIDAGLSPVYRLFNKGGFHLYTAEINDRSSFLTDTKFQDEGIEGYAIKINPAASCPTSPSVTYPVYRLFHASNDKYRLATSEALRNQLTAKGYVDQGVLFCATDVSRIPVIVTPPICNPPACANPPSGYTYSSPTIVNGCQTSCGNLIPITSSCGSLPTGYPESTCSGFYRNTGNAQVVNYCDCVGNITPPPPPPPTSNASCTLGNTTIAHGAPATAYQAASVTAPATCQSQSQTCNNGVLTATTRTTEKFLYSACTVVPSIIVPPAGSVTCTDQPTDQTYSYDGRTNTGGSFRERTFHNLGQITASFALIPGEHTVTAGLPKRYNFFQANRFIWEWIGPDFPDGFQMTISPCRGDFTSANAQKISVPGYTPQDNRVDVMGSIAIFFDEPAHEPRGTVYSMSLPSNRTWYINVKNDRCLSNQACGTSFYFIAVQ